MNSGEGAIFYLAVIAFVAAAVITVVIMLAGVWLAIMAIVAISAIVTGFIIGIKNFYDTVIKAHRVAAGRTPGAVKAVLIAQSYDPQPAELIYFFDTGWFVIQYVAREVWTPTRGQANDWVDLGQKWLSDAKYKNQAQQYFLSAVAIGAIMGGWLHYAAALVFVGVFIAIQAILLVIGSILSTILITFLSVGTWFFGRLNKIFYRCPACSHQMRIPIHVCPTCSTEHTQLWPSVYGVFRHRCLGILPSGDVCRTQLPTLGFLGRSQLAQLCPSCNRELEGIGTGTNIHIPIVGGPGVGKSHFIVLATKDLIEDYAPSHNITVEFPDSQHRSDFDAAVQLLRDEKRLKKTDNAADYASAYNIQLKRSRFRVPKLVYIYDAAGEYFKFEDSAMKQVYFKYTHGILLIIDPFSIPAVYERYKDQLKTSTIEVAPSHQPLDDVFATMLTVLEYSLKVKPGRVVQRPVAVVVTKTDAFLEDQIGKPAAIQLMADNPGIHHEDDAIALLVEQFLRENGEANFVNSLRNTFGRVRFFSVSAVGANSVGDSTLFEGVRVLTPLLWLFGQVNALPLRRERVREVDAYDHMMKQRCFRGKLLASWRYYLWDSLKPIDKTEIL